MKISELITKLEELKKEIGDVPVVVPDNDNEDSLVEASDILRITRRPNRLISAKEIVAIL